MDILSHFPESLIFDQEMLKNSESNLGIVIVIVIVIGGRYLQNILSFIKDSVTQKFYLQVRLDFITIATECFSTTFIIIIKFTCEKIQLHISIGAQNIYWFSL